MRHLCKGGQEDHYWNYKNSTPENSLLVAVLVLDFNNGFNLVAHGQSVFHCHSFAVTLAT
jgi:hypothetical protein